MPLWPFLSKGHMLVLPILDELIAKVCDNTHFLEPFIEFDEVLKVKKVIQKPRVENQLGPDAQHVIASDVFQHKFGTKGKQRLHRINCLTKIKVPLSMRLELDQMQLDPEDKPVYEDVAMTVELML